MSNILSWPKRCTGRCQALFVIKKKKNSTKWCVLGNGLKSSIDLAVLKFTGGLFHKLETATAKTLSLQVFSLHLQTSNIILCVDRIALTVACRCSNTDVLSAPARFSNQAIQASNWILPDRKLVKSSQNKYDTITVSFQSEDM